MVYFVAEGAGCNGACPGAVCGALVGTSVFVGATGTVAEGVTGFAVSTTVRSIKPIIKPPKVQVDFSMKSLVR